MFALIAIVEACIIAMFKDKRSYAVYLIAAVYFALETCFFLFRYTNEELAGTIAKISPFVCIAALFAILIARGKNNDQ